MYKSSETYLETIYRIAEEQGKNDVRVTDIAARMGVAKPSVTRAVSNLKADGLLMQEVYGNIQLTEEGIKLAKQTYSKFKILAFFLIEILGVDREQALKDAKILEHGISEESLTKLKSFVIQKGFCLSMCQKNKISES